MKYISFVQKIFNKVNRKKLKNKDFTLVTSNCTGGILYHWLGLKFRSPFINLYMSNEDYIKALENFELFLSTPLKEYKRNENYPIGIGYSNVKIHFVHYTSFEEANNKWKERIKRIDKQNLCVWLTNWGGGIDVLESLKKKIKLYL